MVNLKFADTHNMVTFLSKPIESDGFDQIVDILNAQPIRYVLTVNPTIYISLALNNSGLLAWSKLSIGNECNDQEKEDNVNITNNVNAAGTNKVNGVGGKTRIELSFDPNMPALEDYSIFDFSRDDEDDDHPLNHMIRDLQSAIQTRKMSKNLEEHGFEEPKKVIHTLKDPSWIEAMQEELLQFKLQEVWTLVDLPNGKMVICSKWVFRNKKDEREIVIRNKARLAILAYASFKDFVVYQLDVNSAFLNEKIEEEVYLLELVYVDDIIFGSTKKEICIAFEKLMHEKFQMSSMGELTFFLGLQVKQKKDGICRILVILRSTKNNK
ncbi:putative ribonuclease H-like domain-containing protein [Tanacetum coccineum]